MSRITTEADLIALTSGHARIAGETGRKFLKDTVNCPDGRWPAGGFPGPVSDLHYFPSGASQHKQNITKSDKRGKANKTELEYAARLSFEFAGCKPKFEAVTLHLLNGHAYTPDWQIVLPDGTLLFVEVKARGKNGFRHPSYQRARVMFDQSRLEYPMWKFRWAEKQSGQWDVKDYE
jgi:hypothetical protein